MTPEETNLLRTKVAQLAHQAQEQGSATAWFEEVYTQARGDAGQIPWAKMQPHPQLESWLEGANLDPKGKTALVIGCGLGDDAEMLSEKGFQVSAFDISPTAIAWCQQRFPDSRVNYQVADLLALGEGIIPTFTLVIESRTIQALPLELRVQALEAISRRVSPQGTLLVICTLRPEESLPEGPPWPLTEAELALFSGWGLQEIKRTDFWDRERPHVCLEYRKNDAA
jgi:SAM-dependent methyltransferase